jgi:hypothetical protein
LFIEFGICDLNTPSYHHLFRTKVGVISKVHQAMERVTRSYLATGGFGSSRLALTYLLTKPPLDGVRV